MKCETTDILRSVCKIKEIVNKYQKCTLWLVVMANSVDAAKPNSKNAYANTLLLTHHSVEPQQLCFLTRISTLYIYECICANMFFHVLANI